MLCMRTEACLYVVFCLFGMNLALDWVFPKTPQSEEDTIGTTCALCKKYANVYIKRLLHFVTYVVSKS